MILLISLFAVVRFLCNDASVGLYLFVKDLVNRKVSVLLFFVYFIVYDRIWFIYHSISNNF